MSTTPNGKVRVTLYMNADTKSGLMKAAEREHRSVSAMSELILSDYLAAQAKKPKRKLV